MSAWELTNFTAALVLPPGALILLGLVGLGLMRALPRLGKWVATCSVLSLLVLSIPFVTNELLRALETPYVDPLTHRADAIVVLGGGTRPRAPEYGEDTPGYATLERLRYAAHLHQRTKTPILVTGGNPSHADMTEGAVMKAALSEFGVSTAWVEESSNNTLENARLSYRMLEKAGIKTIYLVTQAWHMPRARMAFEQAGFTVVPAGTAYMPKSRVMVLEFVPSARALADSGIFFHEIAGLAWYRLKFALGK